MDKQEARFSAMRTSVIHIAPGAVRLVALKRELALLRSKLIAERGFVWLGFPKEESNGCLYG